MIRGGGFHAGGLLFAASSERIMSDSSGMSSGHWLSAGVRTESSCEASMVDSVCREKGLILRHSSKVGEWNKMVEESDCMYATVG